MAAKDEIEALGKAIRDSERYVLDCRAKIASAKQRREESIERAYQASEDAAMMRSKLVAMHNSDIVELVHFMSTRVLYQRNRTISQTKVQDAKELEGVVASLEKQLLWAEFEFRRLSRLRDSYGKVLEFKA